MANFKDDNLGQQVLLNIDFLEILGGSSFEFSLYHLLQREDLVSDFIAQYKNTHSGRKAYHPAMLLRVIFYAYYRGITSSRAIESLCQTDLKFMAMAGGSTPHFTAIANFVSGYPDAIADVFQKVLLICDQSGLIGKEHFAIDGCKIPSDASKRWSGTHKELTRKAQKMRKAAEKIIDKHRTNDGSDGEGSNRARELQSIDTLVSNAEKIEQFLAENEPRMGQGKRPKEVQSNITDPQSAKMVSGHGAFQGYVAVTAADEKHQVIVSAEAYGMGQEHSTLVPTLEAIETQLGVNLSESGTVITADTGFSNEANMKYVFDRRIEAVIPDNQFRKRDPLFADSDTYNAQKAKRKKKRQDKATGREIFAASEFSVNLKSKQCICPAGKAMLYTGEFDDESRGVYSRFRGRLKDCRSCSLNTRCMKKAVKDRGRQVQFLNEDKKHINYLGLMKRKIDSEAGRYQYSKRMWTIEPVFGNITSNKGLSRFSLRGKQKVTGQWMLYCLVHNIEKLWRYGPTIAPV